MKRALTIFILLAYFTVSSGFVVNLHYCMDRFHSWELGAGKEDRCDTCGMAKKKTGCCHDQVKLVKVQQDSAGAWYSVYAFATPAIVPAHSFWMPEPVRQVRELPATPIHGPPLINGQDIYLRHGVFLI